MAELVIGAMGRDDADFLTELAASEGWNPGLHDGRALFCADPSGVLVARLGDERVGCISSVRWSDEYGFVGVHLVREKYRGKGYGLRLWSEAMSRMGRRNVGVVVTEGMIPVLERSGFRPYSHITRYRCEGGGERSRTVLDIEDIHFEAVAAYDTQCFPVSRPRFLECWLNMPLSKAVGVVLDDELVGYGVMRPCWDGFKIGPLYADDVAIADLLYRALASSQSGTSIYIDINEENEHARDLSRKYGMEPVHRAVRMYNRRQPQLKRGKIYSVTAIEFG